MAQQVVTGRTKEILRKAYNESSPAAMAEYFSTAVASGSPDDLRIFFNESEEFIEEVTSETLRKFCENQDPEVTRERSYIFVCVKETLFHLRRKMSHAQQRSGKRMHVFTLDEYFKDVNGQFHVRAHFNPSATHAYLICMAFLCGFVPTDPEDVLKLIDDYVNCLKERYRHTNEMMGINTVPSLHPVEVGGPSMKFYERLSLPVEDMEKNQQDIRAWQMLWNVNDCKFIHWASSS
jgi:hypothetical protein